MRGAAVAASAAARPAGGARTRDWSLLHARVQRSIILKRLLQPGDRVLLAVSGGQDSLCAARILLDLAARWRLALGVVHCDHRWRPDSQASAEYVRGLAAAWRLPYYEEVAEQAVPTEEAARRWRTSVLSRLSAELEYPVVVTGHTATDRAETLLLNLLRGGAADGMQALAWKRPLGVPGGGVFLVRPLLEVTREETGRFCSEFGIRVWEDSTNYEVQYRRNRVRLELMPYLREHFNPQVESVLARSAEVLQAEVEFLEAAAEQLLADSICRSGSGSINRRCLASAPLAVCRRAIRQWVHRQLGVTPDFSNTEKTVALLTAPNRSQSDPLAGRTLVRVEGDWLVLAEATKGSTRGEVEKS